MAMDKDVDRQIKEILSNVKHHKVGYEKTLDNEVLHHQKIIEMTKASPELFDGSLLSVTDKCIGCGICTQVCPVGKYSISEKRAVREEGACEYCQACAQNCPQNAIVSGKTDKNPKARFRNPQISLQELVEANNIHGL
ncbi:MAG: 4Fe-4S dicluster domain-containing protein [Clostridia bacterium]|nr:4Fe-4S dicluster domain-containing protein [Clostridia bacterium]